VLTAVAERALPVDATYGQLAETAQKVSRPHTLAATALARGAQSRLLLPGVDGALQERLHDLLEDDPAAVTKFNQFPIHDGFSCKSLEQATGNTRRISENATDLRYTLRLAVASTPRRNFSSKSSPPPSLANSLPPLRSIGSRIPADRSSSSFGWWMT